MLETTTQKKTFSITAKQAAFIEEQTRSGDYASASEVVRAGLSALEREKALEDERFIASVRETIRKIDSGEMETFPINESFSRVKQRLLARAAAGEF